MEMKCCFAVLCILLMKIQLSYSLKVKDVLGTFLVDPVTSITDDGKRIDVYDLLNWNKASGELTAADLEPFKSSIFCKALAQNGCDLNSVQTTHLKNGKSMTKGSFNGCCRRTRAVALSSYCSRYDRVGRRSTAMFDQNALESAFGLKKEVTQSLFEDGREEITVQQLKDFFESKKQ